MRLIRPCILLFVTLAALLFAPASATASMCSAEGATVTVSVVGYDFLHMKDGGLFAGDRRCGDAATTTTLLIRGGAGREHVSLAPSALGGGATAEATGTSELEIDIDLGADQDSVTFVATEAHSSLVLGTNGLNANGDDDVDVQFAGVEGLTLTGTGAADLLSAAGDAISGAPSALDVEFNARGGDDQLLGGDGNDTVNTSEIDGADVIRGGAGIDKVHYFRRSAAVRVTLAGGADDGDIATGEHDDITQVENVIGSAGDDLLVGTDSGEALDGYRGGDIVEGRGGADYLVGGDGVDEVHGGDDDDVISGGEGADRVFGGSGADRMHGGGADDQIFGGDGADVLEDEGGNDQLYGEAGEDRLCGGQGNDRIVGGSGNDSTFAGHLAPGLGGSGDDTLLGGSGNDRLRGGLGRDQIIGGTGRDQLDGESGDDRLDGSTGLDVLRGGPGRDTLLARDRLSELVDGGPGNDRARVDRVDRLRSIERRF